MTRRPARRAVAALAIAALAGAATACGSPPRAARPASERAAAASAPRRAQDLELPGPARWVLTDRVGALFDEAGRGSPAPRVEPAIVGGVRLLVEGGVVVGSARAAEPLIGFRSLPPRLGGGFLVWSDARTYHAKGFLGALEPVVDVGATGGARPWLDGVLLRTDRGPILLDAALSSATRVTTPGLADALALDEQRGVRVDALGRAGVTTDGGKSFVDLVAARGHVTTAIAEADGAVVLSGLAGRPELRLGPAGDLARLDDPASARGRSAPARPEGDAKYGPAPLEDRIAELRATSRSLPSEAIAHAAFAGALLGARVERGAPHAPDALAAHDGLALLVARDGGLRVLGAASARPIADADLLGVGKDVARCQPVRAGADLLLACAHERGAEVLRLGAALATPSLEATFPRRARATQSLRPDAVAAAVFVGGHGAALGYAGPCGSDPPSRGDFGPGPEAPPSAEDEATLRELQRALDNGGFGGVAPGAAGLGPTPRPPAPPASRAGRREVPDAAERDARALCLRTGGGAWLERRLPARAARQLYRWVPGEDGRATALLIDAAGEVTAKARSRPNGDGVATAARRAPDGVRVVRVRPDDPALGGARWPAPRAPSADPPYWSVDDDFWMEGDAVRGWVRLPDAGDAPEAPPPKDSAPADGAEAPALPGVTARVGGRFAGVTIDGAGKVVLHALPEGTVEVARGGRFALALAEPRDGEPGAARYHESTDGGRTWRPVEAPPVGRLSPPYDAVTIHGCSEIGCTWGDGIVRLGWGGPPPATAKPVEPVAPARSRLVRAPATPRLTCRFEADAGASPKRGPRRGAPVRDAPPPVTLRTRPSTRLGVLRGGALEVDVLAPFQPDAAPRHLTLREKRGAEAGGAALGEPMGAVAPLLTASGAVDLVAFADKRRLRLAGAGAIAPFDHQGSITVLAEAPGGALAALDADRGVLLLASDVGPRPVLRLARMPDVTRTRLTLARRGDAVALVGYSALSGESFAAAVDLGRAEAGPLEPLGGIETLAGAGAGACRDLAASRAAARFVMEVPIAIRAVTKVGEVIAEGSRAATLLVVADASHLCAVGLEAHLGNDDDLVASWSGAGEAVLRRASGALRGRCAFE